MTILRGADVHPDPPRPATPRANGGRRAASIDASLSIAALHELLVEVIALPPRLQPLREARRAGRDARCGWNGGTG